MRLARAARRVGFRGQEFMCFKFRTMRMNAETDSHRQHTQDLIRSQAPFQLAYARWASSLTCDDTCRDCARALAMPSAASPMRSLST